MGLIWPPEAHGAIWGVYLPETARSQGAYLPLARGLSGSIWPPLSTGGVYLQETGGSRRVYLAPRRVYLAPCCERIVLSSR